METINKTKARVRTKTDHIRKGKSLIINSKIVPFLWFDGNAEAAMNFYLSVFKNSKKGEISRYGEAGPGPKGSVMSARFQLEDQAFYALNGGPEFRFTHSTSIYVSCKNVQEINRLWGKLAEGGNVLMELNKYQFSERYGWVQDKFGLSWQLIISNEPHKITPFLMFGQSQQGKAEAAMNFYTSLFKNSSIGSIMRYSDSYAESLIGQVVHADFKLGNQKFMAMDSGVEQPFSFTPAFSFFVNCKTQVEVDNLWDKLLEGGEAMQCGWLKDKFGFTWQIVPTILGEYLSDPDHEKSERVMQAMMQMIKLDIKGLKKAYHDHN